MDLSRTVKSMKGKKYYVNWFLKMSNWFEEIINKQLLCVNSIPNFNEYECMQLI